MYGSRLVEFAHSRKEMHFQHRRWSFLAIVGPGALHPVGDPVAPGWDAVKGRVAFYAPARSLWLEG